MPLPEPLARPETVAVLLSTFNGERYLQKQLDSLLGQTHRDWVVIWRDDGSSDDSSGIMWRFAETVGDHRCIELADTQRHIGATRSYMALLRAAAEFPLVAFADQDDVWLPNKLARAAASLRGAADTFPALYCARHIVADAKLRPVGQSMRLRRAPRFPQLAGAKCRGRLHHRAQSFSGCADQQHQSSGEFGTRLVVLHCGVRGHWAHHRGRCAGDPLPPA